MQFRRQLIPPVIAGLLVMLALLGLIGTAIRDPRPHDIPVGLVGPPAAVQQVTTAKEAGFAARLAVVVVFAVLAGLTGMGTAAWIAGDYGSGFWSATAIAVLASAAIGAVIAGSARLLGTAGLGLAALIVVLVDLVSSGGPVGSQLLPDLYRAIAPWMPAGTLYSGMRGALYFGGAGTGGPIVVLTAWLVGGVVLLWLGGLRSRATNR